MTKFALTLRLARAVRQRADNGADHRALTGRVHIVGKGGDFDALERLVLELEATPRKAVTIPVPTREEIDRLIAEFTPIRSISECQHCEI